MLRTIATAIILSIWIAGLASPALAEALPDRAVVGGHHIQPRIDEFHGKTPDLPKQDSRDVDQLYRELVGHDASPSLQRGQPLGQR